MESKNILVIKHGALGDIILSGAAMKKKTTEIYMGKMLPTNRPKKK